MTQKLPYMRTPGEKPRSLVRLPTSARASRRIDELLTHTKASLKDPPTQNRFVIFAQGRTGTWLLTQMLNDHPQVLCDKEILMFPKVAPIRFLEARAKLIGEPTYGCHVQIKQICEAQRGDPRVFLRRLSDLGWKIIYLRREDIVRQSLSALLATRRQQWVVQKGGRVDTTPQFVDAGDLMRWLELRVARGDAERAALEGLPHLPLVYEHHLLNAESHRDALERVFTYLDVDPVPIEAQTRRLTETPIERQLSNYDELVEAVHKSPFAAFTDLEPA